LPDQETFMQTEDQLFHIAIQHHQDGRLAQAEAVYRKILQDNPENPDALHLLGTLNYQLGNNILAAEFITRAIHIVPDYAIFHDSLGTVYLALNKFEEAATCYRMALALDLNFSGAHFNLGNALQKQGQSDEAIASLQQALSLRPDYVEAYICMGNAFKNLGMKKEAIDNYQKALTLNPDFAEVYFNLGLAFQGQGNHCEAINYFHKALTLKPDYPFALGMCLHSEMHCCNWEGIDESFHNLLNDIDAGKLVSDPFALLATPSTPAQQRSCAELLVLTKHPYVKSATNKKSLRTHAKIRLGYFSPDFYDHPVGKLTAELFERHDRSKFEIFGFYYGTPKNDPIHQRLCTAFDHFIDVRTLSDQEIVTSSRRLEIDIAIDLAGYTANARSGIFAQHTAPIQVNYLGYAGTTGAPYFDYLLADTIVIPIEHQQYYSEKIAYLPNSFFVNGSHRQSSMSALTRSDAGLPNEGFVFCSFNTNYKITPDVFDIWMQILKQVEGSVIWLTDCNVQANQNLRKEATKRGVASDRLIFSKRIDSLPDHLARYQLADLFLDTFVFNAHTTASDALWAGLPVLTCLGETFAGRVAASLLKAIGLPELITQSHEEYKTLAVILATNPKKLATIKHRLLENRETHPLFNTKLFTRHIEDAFTQMYQRYQATLLPDHIYVRENEYRNDSC